MSVSVGLRNLFSWTQRTTWSLLITSVCLCATIAGRYSVFTKAGRMDHVNSLQKSLELGPLAGSADCSVKGVSSPSISTFSAHLVSDAHHRGPFTACLDCSVVSLL